MSAVTVWVGLEERFKTIDGLPGGVHLGEPSSVHEAPLLFAMYTGADQIMRSQRPATNMDGLSHAFTVYIVFDDADYAQAEMQLLTLADSVPSAINDDPRLDNRLYSGIASSTVALSGHYVVATKLYRALQFTVTVVEKRQAT